MCGVGALATQVPGTIQPLICPVNISRHGLDLPMGRFCLHITLSVETHHFLLTAESTSSSPRLKSTYISRAVVYILLKILPFVL